MVRQAKHYFAMCLILEKYQLSLDVNSLFCMYSILEPVDCKWGPYGEWSSCSKTCGGGEKSRTRLVSQLASNGGKACEGEATETTSCNEAACTGMYTTVVSMKCT